jgi:Baseplate J-like protein
MAVKSTADIVAEMISSMSLTEPEVDTSIGSFMRKVFDVVGEQIAPAYAERHVMQSSFNVDAKSGPDLDEFCSQFGIHRLAARRAVGVALFVRPEAAVQNIVIPANTQIATGTMPQIVFTTVAPAVLLLGTTSVAIPIQAVVAGESGNLPADALTNLLSPLSGVSASTSQSDATSGGVNAESDEALRLRFRRTLFRSMAGLEDMFIGVAIEDSTPDDPTDSVAQQANVLGASKRWREQVQVVADGADLVAESTLPTGSAKYIFPGSAFVGEDLDGGEVLKEGVHFTFDHTASPPTITAIGEGLVEDRVYDLDFKYVPSASRNDPEEGITNRVDIWVSGVAAQQANEVSYFRSTAFSETSTDALYRQKFVRLEGNGATHPTAANLFVQLAWGPIIDFPNTLTISEETYVRGTDYWVVHDDSGHGYSPTSMFGLEWLASNAPATNSRILLADAQAYFYNRTPADVEARARTWKLTTTDIKAHAAKQIRLALNFAVMYSASYDRAAVQAELDRTMAVWMNTLGFRSVVQVSDILSVAHSVAGVDNVRFLNSLESSTGEDDDWGIQRVTSNGTHIAHFASGSTPARATDIVLAENEVPVLMDIRYLTKAQNSYTEPDA